MWCGFTATQFLWPNLLQNKVVDVCCFKMSENYVCPIFPDWDCIDHTFNSNWGTLSLCIALVEKFQQNGQEKSQLHSMQEGKEDDYFVEYSAMESH
jgi:hypothetical protein